MESTNEAAALVPDAGRAQGTALMASAAHAAQELRLAYETAREFPRDDDAAARLLQKACTRISLADAAEYEYPRGKKKNEETGEWEANMVRGTSVYLAREAARIWGHVRAGFAILEDDGENRHIRAEARDLQTGASFVQDAMFPKQVQRREKVGVDANNRPIFKTRYIPAEPRELLELTNKEGAKAVRNCLLQILPDWYVEEALEVARKTLDEASTVAVREAAESDEPHAAVLRVFAGFSPSVPREAIEAHFGKPMAELDASEVATLRRYGRSIRDGQAAPGDYFDLATAEPEGDANGGERASPASSIDEALDASASAAEPDPERAEPEKDGRSGDGSLDELFEG